ncbi:MAG: zinc dependent phospholipase C family protein, partial [Pseudomonadota bacterium]
MNLLELVIIAHRCRSTHHFIAFDALQLLKGEHAQDWKNLLLKHHTSLLRGAKAPDKEFKDFQNHVLHVEDGEWGGARDAAMEWYGKAVAAMREQKWSKAAYALGVLTHYYADPIQPFHTAQSEEEGTMHRALEWSIAKSRDTIKALIDSRGYPHVHAGSDTGFVADMVLAGAKYSNPHYQTFIDHYDLHKGVANPQEGLDQTLLDILADLVAYATAGVSVLFERAFAEAAVKPPKVDLDMPGYFAALDIPIRRITKRMADAKDRKTVEAMYAEFVETGKVIKTLPDDDKKIRALHCKHILRQPIEWLDAMPIRPIGTKHVPLPKHPEPVEYQLKVVPVPTGEPVSAARTPTVAPDPEVFEDAAPETLEAAPVDPAPVEPATAVPQSVETASAAEAMLAELDAVEMPKPELVPETEENPERPSQS